MFIKKTTKLYIDAGPIVSEHFSGVGHSLLGLLKALEDIKSNDKKLLVTLVVPDEHVSKLALMGFKFPIKGIPLSQHKIAELQVQGILPNLDEIIGRGTYFFPNFLSWPLRWSKSILLIHDISFELHPEFVDPPNQKFLSNNVPISAERATVVATVSPNAKVEIEQQYQLKKDSVLVLPNAVDRNLFYRREKAEINNTKKSYGVSGRYFIFVGNLEPRKNIVRLINAYKMLPKETTNEISLLLIGGEGWNDEEIKQSIKKAREGGFNILRPNKFVKDIDLPALYSGAEALVYVPIYEGFGMPPLEAMACETPVISSNVSSLPWVVGKAGIVIDPYNELQMSNAMKRVLEDSVRASLISFATEHLKKFSWEDTARTLVDKAKKL